MVDSEVRRFRPNVRALLIALAANVLLAAIFLGIPYVQGRLRASGARDDFAALAACLWGGEAKADPGLGVPRGKRERFATRVLHAPSDWPARCEGDLDALEPQDAWLLFPSVKGAERNVRDAVALVRRQLRALSAERRGGVDAIPSKPYVAIDRLVAALSMRAEAAGADEGLDAEAIELGEAKGDLVEPTKVPLDVPESASLDLVPHGDGVIATALGRRSTVRVRVGAGGLDKSKRERPALARAVVRGPEGPWLVWAMEEERCREDEHRCARRATGLAPLAADAEDPPPPQWIAAHPEGRADRSVHIGPDRGVWIVARRQQSPAAELRRFALPPTGARPADGEQGEQSGQQEQPDEDGIEPLRAKETVALSGYAEDDVAVALEAGRVAWTTHEPASLVLRAHPGGGTARLEGAPETTWLTTCRAGDITWLAFGGAERVGMARLAGDTLEALDPVPLQVAVPAVHPTEARADAVVIACDVAHADIVGRAPNDALYVAACERGGCGEPVSITSTAARFAATRDGGTTVVAWSREAHDGQVRVVPLDADGRPRGDPSVPAACWTEEGGLCGAPVLAARNGRFLLGARDGADLLLLESTDAAASWRPMRGLR